MFEMVAVGMPRGPAVRNNDHVPVGNPVDRILRLENDPLGHPDKARVAKAKNDIRALESALDIYRLDNYVYPTTDQGLESLVSQPTSSPEAPNWKQGGYVKKLSNDPWGNAYLYLNPGEHGEIDIYSLGADSAPGGEGPNTDIGSWD